jgi:hypothetical protein
VEPSVRPEVQDTCKLRIGFNPVKLDYNKLGYNKLGYNKLGYNKLGYNKLGYKKAGYNKLGFNKLSLTTNIFLSVVGFCHLERRCFPGYNKPQFNEHNLSVPSRSL